MTGRERLAADHERVERIAKHIAARIYRARWDQLTEHDKHSTRALARLAIEDVAAGDQP